jgi:hypothetical protein
MPMIDNLIVGVLRDRLGRHLVSLNMMDIVLSGLVLVCITRGLVRRAQHHWSRRRGSRW